MPKINLRYAEWICVVLILVLALFLYTYKLHTNPPGLYLDEVGSGYNAYSILKTGRDEYGKLLPLAFKLFGSFTPPLFIYLSVPMIGIFGLSLFSVRILSVICGVVSSLLFFYIVKEIKIVSNKYTPILALIFFVITPWLVFYSRMGYEQNLAFMFLCLSSLLVIKSFKNLKILFIAIPVISIATYADFPMKIVMPLLFIGSMILLYKNINFKNSYKQIIISILIAGFIQIPNLYLLTTPSSYTKTDHFYSDVILSQAKKIEVYLPKPVSTALSFTREFLSQYFNYFSPRSLFFLPDEDPQRSMPELSVFYPWMAIPYILGLYLLYKNRNNKYSKFIILLLLITPLPGALTKQPFHIQRTVGLLLPISLVITMGIDKLLSNTNKLIWLPVSATLFLFSLLLFWRSYFVLLPTIRATVWAFEFKNLAEYIKLHPDKKYIIDQTLNPKPEEIAYEQMAFYLEIDPKVVQSDQKENVSKYYYQDTSFNPYHKLLNLEFKPIDWGEANDPNIVFVGNLSAISDVEVVRHNLEKVFEINDPNTGEAVLRGFQTNH